MPLVDAFAYRSNKCDRCGRRLNHGRRRFAKCPKCAQEIADNVTSEFQANIGHELTEAIVHSSGPVSSNFKALPVFEGVFFIEGPDGELYESIHCPRHLKSKNAQDSRLSSTIAIEETTERTGKTWRNKNPS